MTPSPPHWPQHRSRRTFTAACLAVAILTSACGAAPSLPIGVKEYPADIVYGDTSKPEPPAPVPGADPAPAFPGFLAPPAPRTELPGQSPSTTTPRPSTTLAPVACPADDPLEVPRKEAPPEVRDDPQPGRYLFRQEGVARVDGKVASTLAPSAERRLDNLRALQLSSYRFDLTVKEFEAETTTTYEVARRGAENGLHIAQIRSSDPFGTSAFTPSAPVKLLPFPANTGSRWRSAGTDPLHGITLSINGLVKGKTRVNACGTPLDAWLVEVGTDPQTGQPSRIVGPGRSVVITGTYAVATQFGGLIVAEDLTLDGTDGGRPVKITTKTAISDPEPRPL